MFEKIMKFGCGFIVISIVFFSSCSSSPDNITEQDVTKEQAHLEGVFNANSVILHPGSNNWYGIDISRANQGGRIKMRSPPKVLTGNFRPSQLSFFLS